MAFCALPQWRPLAVCINKLTVNWSGSANREFRIMKSMSYCDERACIIYVSLNDDVCQCLCWLLCCLIQRVSSVPLVLLAEELNSTATCPILTLPPNTCHQLQFWGSMNLLACAPPHMQTMSAGVYPDTNQTHYLICTQNKDRSASSKTKGRITLNMLLDIKWDLCVQ